MLKPLHNCTHLAAAAAAKSLQLCPTLCDAIDVSPPGFSVPGILQARILEWVAISFSNVCMHAKLLQSCSTLSNSMDCSLPGSSVQGIFQARVLERVATAFSNYFPSVTWVHLCGSLNILWHCLSLGLEWKLTFSSIVAKAEFSKFSGILGAALSQHHLLGFEIAQLGFCHLH